MSRGPNHQTAPRPAINAAPANSQVLRFSSMVGDLHDQADNRLSIRQLSGSIAGYTGASRWKDGLVRVLIVEDDSELGKRMVASLVRHGFTCEWVQSAEDAEDFAFDGFAVLIVDLGLPGIGGIELIRRLRQRRLVAPILIFTARSSWQEKVEGLNAGADDFLVKPVRIEELVARLHALLRRSAGRTM
ncbi:MAG TPA: response regulator, partial [Polymorphobacter sp.]|nr:response regulator [Polymorphobacter sp.]